MKDISKGYIALYRQFIDWEWYDDANTMRLFIHCLLLANHKDKKWRGKTIKRGQFITSQSKLANSLKLSIMQIRNSLKKLKTTGEITVYTTADYSVITVNLYDSYQDKEQTREQAKDTTNEQANNRLTTTTNNDNNISNTSYINISLSNKKITKEEREILRNYLLRQKRKPDNPEAYLKTLIKNGDWVEIVKKEKQRLERLDKKKQEEKEKNIKQVENESQESEEQRKEAQKKAHEFIEKIKRRNK